MSADRLDDFTLPPELRGRIHEFCREIVVFVAPHHRGKLMRALATDGGITACLECYPDAPANIIVTLWLSSTNDDDTSEFAFPASLIGVEERDGMLGFVPVD